MNKYTSLLGVFWILILWGCDSEISIPNPIVTPQTITDSQMQLVDLCTLVHNLQTQITQDTDPVQYFEDQNNTFIEGYVISSDQSGNFYHKLVLQNTTENPSCGIELLLNEDALYQRFPIGTKVQIKLHGLSMVKTSGKVQLGQWFQEEVSELSSFLIDEKVFSTGVIQEIIPATKSLGALQEADVSTFIRIDTLAFAQNLLQPTPKSFAGESTDSFQGERILEHCESGLELILSTSTFAQFKFLNLPLGSGSIAGVFSKDYFGDQYIIQVNTPQDIIFDTQMPSCETSYFSCEDASFEAVLNAKKTPIFTEDFLEITNENQLITSGWTNSNITGDFERWEDYKITNQDYRVMSISAYNTNLQPLEAWLITPELSIPDNENHEVFFNFRLRTLYNNGDGLKVYVSENFTTDIITATWQEFALELPRNSSNFQTFSKQISCLKGKQVHFAFQYKGYDPFITSRYDLDFVELLEISNVNE